MIDYNGARDEILTRLKYSFDMGASVICGHYPIVNWPGIDAGGVDDASKVRVNIYFTGCDTQLRTIAQGTNKRKYDNFGIIVVRITPVKSSNGLNVALALAKLVHTSLQGGTDNVIFRYSKTREIPIDGIFHVDCVTEFEFDELS